MPHRVQFSYWSDPLCIWALVAQQKLNRVLGELGDRVRVDYRIVPVFGSVPWRFAAGPWAKDGVDGRVAATRRIAEQGGRSDVSGECWRRAMPASSWAPAAAIKAVFALGDGRGDEAGPAYQHALRERFFVAELNVALRAVQLEVAEELALPRAPIEARLDDGSALAAVCEDHAEKERLRIQKGRRRTCSTAAVPCSTATSITASSGAQSRSSCAALARVDRSTHLDRPTGRSESSGDIAVLELATAASVTPIPVNLEATKVLGLKDARVVGFGLTGAPMVAQRLLCQRPCRRLEAGPRRIRLTDSLGNSRKRPRP